MSSVIDYLSSTLDSLSIGLYIYKQNERSGKESTMKYTAHVNMVTKPYIGLPTTRTPYTLVDADWATTWMIDETYEAHYHGTSVEISIYGEGPNCSVLTNRIYTDQPTDVTAALANYGFTIDTTNTSKTILTLTRTATISHLLAILDGLPQAEGTHWLNTQPDLHHITLDDSTTGWATNRTDDTDTGVCYDTSTHNWQIC